MLAGAGFCLSSGTMFSHLAGNVTLFPTSYVFEKYDGCQGI